MSIISMMSPYRFAFLLCSSSVLALASDGACDDDTGVCSGDVVSALQLGKRSDTARASAPDPEWRDAIEHEKEVITRLSMLQTQVADGDLPKGGEDSGKRWEAPNSYADPADPNPAAGWARVDVFPGLPRSYDWAKQAARSPDPCTKKIGWDPPSEPLRDIPSVSSEAGFLETTIVVDAGWIEVPWTGVRVKARLYNGSYPGPTLRVRRGDHIKVKVVNKLGPNEPEDAYFMRREGQGTARFPGGIPADHPQYQDVGQKPGEPNRFPGVPNTLHKSNTTNLHTHGWHVSPNLGQDDVLSTVIEPGESWTYEYFLSAYHSSGNSWYHDHQHGTVAEQTNGGLIGALIVEDEEGEVPKWVAEARDVLTVIHEADWSYFGPSYMKFFPDDPYTGCWPFGSRNSFFCGGGHRTGLIANLSGDRLWKMEYKKGFGYASGETIPMTSFFSVNGQFRPYIEMKTGEWVRLRLVFASGNAPINPIFNDTRCEMQLISKDSVLLEDLPRKLKKGAYLGAGARAQVMIRCSEPGTYTIHSAFYPFFSVLASYDLMRVKVTGDKVSNMAEPEKQISKRPRYLQSLLDISREDLYKPKAPNMGAVVNEFNGKKLGFNGKGPENSSVFGGADGKTLISRMTFDFPTGPASPRFPLSPTQFIKTPARYTINNMTFNESVPSASFEVAKIIEIEMSGLNEHSYHIHVTPVQFTDFIGKTDAEVEEAWGGFFKKGDWQDTIQIPGQDAVRARLQTDCYNGKIVMHCHILFHEDVGMMTWFEVQGKDLTINPRFSNDGIFAKPPAHCLKDGQQCAPPQCSDYAYGKRG